MTVWMWRALIALRDMAWLRRVTERTVFDFVFISNMRDEVDKKRFRGRQVSGGHFIGPRFKMKDTRGCIRFIDTSTEELMTASGRRRAQTQFLSAVRWAHSQGAKVVLFAAGTKRIFPEDRMEQLVKDYPDIVFTLGDNGTATMLINDVMDGIKATGLGKDCQIAVIGPSGYLGEMVTSFLTKNGYRVCGVSAHIKRSEQISQKFGIPVHGSITEVSGIDLVVACNHGHAVRLTANQTARMKKNLVVIDVCVPPNFTEPEFSKTETVYRRDAGNAYSPDLKYVFGRLSYGRLRMAEGLVFGCFAETITLAYLLKAGYDSVYLESVDWFNVSAEKIELVKKMFILSGFTNSPPRSFGRFL